MCPVATRPASVPAVQLEGVTKRFARNWALKSVSLTIPPGESVCLLGPNGSGKTTLLRIVATATRPTAGQALVFGYEAADDGDAVRSRIGLLSHRTFLYGELTARENLRFAAGMYGIPPGNARLDAALADVGLAPAADTRVRAFSQGMAQRLALARATLHAPPLLLLDEPYSGLDADALQLLDRYLGSFLARGGTMVLVTHQLAKGLTACRRAVALREGRVVFDGASADFRSSPEAALVGEWG